MNVEFDGFIGQFDDFFDEKWIDELVKYFHTFNDLGAYQGQYLPKHLRDDTQLYFMDPVRIHDVHPHYAEYFFKVLKEQICPNTMKSLVYCKKENTNSNN